MDHLVAPCQHGCRVERADRHPWHAPRLVRQLDRSEQRLGRHAGVERALAADQPVLDDRDRTARSRRAGPRTPRRPRRRPARPRRTRARSRSLRFSVLGGGQTLRAADAPGRRDGRSGGAEIGLRERPHEPSTPRPRDRAPGRPRRPVASPPGAAESMVPSPRNVTRRMAVVRERPAEDELTVAAEVPERVGDQPAVVPLDPAQHVRARSDDEIRSCIDDRVGERERRSRGSRRGTSPCRA